MIRLIALLAANLALLLVTADIVADDVARFSGKTMGPIEYHVVVAGVDESFEHDAVADAIQGRLDRINELMSTYRPDSDLSRFNQSRSTDWHEVDAETARVVSRAMEISAVSKGAFDVTIGPAVNLWQFGPGKAKSFTIPADDEIAAVQKIVGYEKIEVRTDPPAIRKRHPEMEIDLSAIAKGYAVDEVAGVLKSLQLKNYMVEIGGEVYAQGQRAGGGPWRIGIEHPRELVREIGRIASLSNAAMATSGDYRIFETDGGKRFSHTIDPATCRPVNHFLASACVVAGDCMTADAVATAVMVMGAEPGVSFCQDNGFEVFTLTRDSDFGSQLTELSTDRFPFAELASVADESDSPANSGESIWPTFIGAAVVFLLAILGMAVGAIFNNKPVQGSCGGLSTMSGEDDDASCTVCAKPVTDCINKQPANPE